MKYPRARGRPSDSSVAAAAAVSRMCVIVSMSVGGSCAFSSVRRPSFTCGRQWIFQRVPIVGDHCESRLGMIYAPPGSGYVEKDDETEFLPKDYEPTMEYPGTMRPGRTPENMPYQSLPIADSDPDPVPWPHFQEIEWHHQWEPPNEHPIPMEEFIDMHGRWATIEDEAAMRAGQRRGVRERRELEEAEKTATLIMDDDEDEDEEAERGASAVMPDLGEGVDVLIGSEVAASQTAIAAGTAEGAATGLDEDEEDEEDEGDFLLDLGLDSDEGESGGGPATATAVPDDDDGNEPAFATGADDGSTQSLLEAMQSMIDSVDDEDEDDVEEDGVDLDMDLGLDLLGGSPEKESSNNMMDDDDDVLDFDDDGGMEEISLDDLSAEEDTGDDDSFDDGGFDYE